MAPRVSAPTALVRSSGSRRLIAAHFRGEQRGVTVHRHHVAMLDDAPKPAPVRVVLPGDRRLAAQARKDVVLLAPLEHVEIKQINVHAEDVRVKERLRQARVGAEPDSYATFTVVGCNGTAIIVLCCNGW